MGTSLAAAESGGMPQGAGTTASPYVDPETGEHIVFAAPSPAPSYPDLTPYLQGGGDGTPVARDTSSDILLAAGPGYTGLGQSGGDRLILDGQPSNDDLDAMIAGAKAGLSKIEAQNAQVRDDAIQGQLYQNDPTVMAVNTPDTDLETRAMQWVSSQQPIGSLPIEPPDVTPLTFSPVDFQPIDIQVAGGQDPSVSLPSSPQDSGSSGSFLDSRGTAGYSLVSWWDAQQRVGYKAAATANSNAYMQEINNLARTQVTEGQAIAQDAFDARQALRTATQNKLTPGGRLISQAIETNYTFDGQVAKYTGQVAERGPFSQMDVYRSIVRASGSSNALVSGFNKFSRVAGPVCAVVGLGASAYNIANAAPGQTGRVVSEETGGFLGGMAGGMAATYVVGGLALAAGAVGVTVAAPVILIGGAIAGVAGALYGSQYGRDAGDYYYDTFSARWSH